MRVLSNPEGLTCLLKILENGFISTHSTGYFLELALA
jgi:hypothetical protein